MTDHKPWLWRRKSSDKGNTAIAENADSISKESVEMRNLHWEKGELERNLEDLSTRLSAALSECNAKDEIAKKHAKTAQEALAGWEKAESTALSLKQELNMAVEARVASEARSSQLDAALKESMQQLHFVREQQEHRVHDALTIALQEFDHARLDLEEKLGECSKMIAKLGMENDQLSQILLHKEQSIDDLNQQRIKAASDLSALLGRMESMEKDNNSLKYEVRLLEKELDIRNEEKEFNQRTTDAAHKQHLENVKKIARLESECQRLRVLMKKRLPGPAALAKMKNEVEMIERGPTDNDNNNTTTRRKLNGNLSSRQQQPVYYAPVEASPENPSKKINLLIEKLCSLEEENNALRESLSKKANELQNSRNLYAQAAARLFQAGSQLEDSFLSSASMPDIGSDAGSWACALITELDHFRGGKHNKGGGGLSCKSTGASDKSMMDDFAEMEKLALVCVDDPIQNSLHESPSGSTGKKHVSSSESSLASASDSHMSKGNKYNDGEIIHPNLKRSVSKLVEIIDGMNLSSQECDHSPCLADSSSLYQNPEAATGCYTVHVFRVKTSELDTVLQSFLRACGDLLRGEADFGTFVQELTRTLEWILNQCCPLKDNVSSVKDAIEKPLNWDGLKDTAEQELVEHHDPLAAASGFDGVLHDETQQQLECIEQYERTENESAGEEESEDPLHHPVDDNNSLTHHPHKSEAMFEHGNEDEKQLRTEEEILAASEKLAQCQETILNLGRQLKALASSPSDALLFDKVISTHTPTTPKMSTVTEATQEEDYRAQRRSSLLDKMLADEDDDGAGGDQLESPKTKEIICDSNESRILDPELESYKGVIESDDRRSKFIDSAAGSLAIVPSKKKNGGFFKKLLWGRKKGKSKKLLLPFPA
ncbi:hypothetical protein Dimus_017170 [Dionaea muscipula]